MKAGITIVIILLGLITLSNVFGGVKAVPTPSSTSLTFKET
jgi:hypothetical protein